MFYDKFRDSQNLQTSGTESVVHETKNSSEYSSQYSEGIKRNEINAINCLLDNFYGKESLKIDLTRFLGFGMEEDGPFDGIAPDDAALDDPEEGSQSEGTDTDNLNDPFGNLVDEQENIFGDDQSGDDQGEQDQKTQQLEFDRNELLKSSHDLSTSIRQLFPKRFIELQDVIASNIKVVEKLSLYTGESDDIIQGIMGAYNDQNRLISDYLNIITEQTFDQIFEMYLKIHTNCMQIKETYDLILNELVPDKKRKVDAPLKS